MDERGTLSDLSVFSFIRRKCISVSSEDNHLYVSRDVSMCRNFASCYIFLYKLLLYYIPRFVCPRYHITRPSFRHCRFLDAKILSLILIFLIIFQYLQLSFFRSILSFNYGRLTPTSDNSIWMRDRRFVFSNRLRQLSRRNLRSWRIDSGLYVLFPWGESHSCSLAGFHSRRNK